MIRKLRPLAALAIVALIGAGASDSLAANGRTESKRSSSAPGTLPPKGSSHSNRPSRPKRSSRPNASSAPGTLPPRSSR